MLNRNACRDTSRNEAKGGCEQNLETWNVLVLINSQDYEKGISWNSHQEA